MEYQTHRTVISDHELIVDNVVYRERKEMSKVSQEGLDSDDYVLSHSRLIGEDFYTINHVFKDKIMETENIDTNLDDEALENFKNQWQVNNVFNCILYDESRRMANKLYSIFYSIGILETKDWTKTRRRVRKIKGLIQVV